ncbi:ABC transporter permease [Sediminibacillus massiliensis]|uniref:ABC transporter permease n=1 Tax=Sediminibacillus massiliensis TaxID=1926277 RepID=UPI0015C2DCBD|nr:ABC transporter permease [Sediminibacillus massiliensis]
MNLTENLLMAITSLKTNKLRSFLSMIGIIIGVSSVIVVMSIGRGGEKLITDNLIGSASTIDIIYQPSEDEMGEEYFSQTQSHFDETDIDMLEKIPHVINVITSSTDSTTINYKGRMDMLPVKGINQTYLASKDIQLDSGSHFSAIDFVQGRRIGYIDYSIKEKLFEQGTNPIGEVIRVNGQPIEIVGLIEKSDGLFASDNNQVVLPAKTWKNIFNNEEFTELSLQVDNVNQISIVGNHATTLLNDTHNVNGTFEIINLERISDGISSITRILSLVVSSIAGISLLVGGIGIMNIMLVSVTERTKEIGLRKAIGASRTQILTQFLIESVAITLIGGSIGVLVGWGITSIISVLGILPAAVSWVTVTVLLILSMFIGILFGIVPAAKASKLNPIEALRYE